MVSILPGLFLTCGFYFTETFIFNLRLLFYQDFFTCAFYFTKIFLPAPSILPRFFYLLLLFYWDFFTGGFYFTGIVFLPAPSILPRFFFLPISSFLDTFLQMTFLLMPSILPRFFFQLPFYYRLFFTDCFFYTSPFSFLTTAFFPTGFLPTDFLPMPSILPRFFLFYQLPFYQLYLLPSDLRADAGTVGVLREPAAGGHGGQHRLNRPAVGLGCR